MFLSEKKCIGVTLKAESGCGIGLDQARVPRKALLQPLGALGCVNGVGHCHSRALCHGDGAAQHSTTAGSS